MDVPDGFVPYEDQGPFLEHIGPVHVREGDANGLRFGLRAEDRHANHRGTIQGGRLSTFADFVLGRAIESDAEDGRDRATARLTVEDREIVRARAVWAVVGCATRRLRRPVDCASQRPLTDRKCS